MTHFLLKFNYKCLLTVFSWKKMSKKNTLVLDMDYFIPIYSKEFPKLNVYYKYYIFIINIIYLINLKYLSIFKLFIII